MKICKLKLKNLNSFREAVELNFQNPPLDDASLVAITGPTGAGKTTLLDAICVALYGKTPRLSGTTNQHPRHLISHGETEGFAEVYFEANNTCYHATWSMRRNRSPQSQLFNDTGELITTNVAQEVESILGLNFGAFRRSVMLAQGEFAAFLKASMEERRAILEATAGIHIYDILRQTLNDKVRDVTAANAEVTDKLNKIPDASREQLADAETVLGGLEAEAEALGTESQQIQREKTRETKRKEDFEKLQVSEERHRELSDQQPEIDTLESERVLAEKAQRLLSEKQAFDTAVSALENADETLRVATTEKTEAMQQVETDQADFDAKAGVFTEASDEYAQRTEVYTAAKSDIERAKERFEAADKRTPDLEDLGEQIRTLKGKLTERGTEQTQLQERIGEAQVFLDDNHLPVNSPQRLNTATGLLAELTAHQKQLETTSVNEVEYDKRISALKQEIKKLSDTHAGLLSKKTDAETTLENATAELNKLLAIGTRGEWAARKQQAARVQPIVQRGEEVVEDAENISGQVAQLSDTVSSLNAELAQTEEKLQEQTEAHRHAVEEVERYEAALRSLMLTNPINQLRQHLHTGEPCLVCGATEHPFADVVEPESESLLQDTEAALAKVKADTQAAQDQMQISKTKRTQAKHNMRSTVNLISEFAAEVEALRDEGESLDRQWEEASPDFNTAFDSIIEQDIKVSSAWIAEQIEKADTAIAALVEAEQERTTASHAYDIVTRQLQTCENDIARETDSLNETKEQLENISSAVEDLKMDIKSIETRFWELLPEAFHGATPKEAKDLFEDKIKAVEVREDARDTAKAQLQVLDANIAADQSSLKDLKKRHEALQAEIDTYQCEGEAFLDAAREKTQGLETEDAINAAIDRLETDLQAKEKARDAADKRLQKSRESLTQKRTAHDISEKLRAQCSEKFDNAYRDYTDKLRDAGFDSLAAHNEAFRDEAQLQALTAQIDAYKSEIQQLALAITELQTRFEETPFDPEALGQIEIKLEEIEAQLQARREDIGAHGERVDNLKDALQKREALGDEMQAAQQQLECWKRLQETIPANTLRDFALEIMFRQMGSLANEQLKYLTSERYQLNVKGIGDLSVVDRWNANEERPVETLSGGESFLTSLALALALSELSRGRAQLNSLFLDEGFGTLDSETLDTAIAALEGLRMQGRNIFLISHIRELTRRLPVKIEVTKKGNGSSSVKIQG